MDEFRALIATFQVDIIAITETWLNTGERDFEGEYSLPGYTMFHKDRHLRVGGGVLLYVRRHLTPVQIPCATPLEIVGVELRGCGTALQVIVVYRPPHQNAESDLALYETITRLIREKPSLIVGDFNCAVDWDQLTAVGDDDEPEDQHDPLVRAILSLTPQGSRLVDFMYDNFLVQTVLEPTRGHNILDLIFTTNEEFISEVEIGDCLASSDHRVVSCKVQIGSNPEELLYRERLNLRRADYARFRRELRGLRPHAEGSVEDQWTGFKTSFMAIQSACIPTKVLGGRTDVKPSWFHRGISCAIKERKRRYNVHKRNPSRATMRLYAQQKRKVKRLVRRAKVAEEHRVALACRRNPKEFYGYVNRHKPRTPLGPVVSDAGHLVTSNPDIAREFNSYFSSVFTVEDGNIPAPVISYDGEDALRQVRCTELEVVAKIRALDPNKAAGPDGYLPKVVKAVADEVGVHLCQIFNRSLETGEVPLDMRSANVSPIHKKGPLTDRGNFRPISLTSVPGKLLESLVKDKIVEHLDRHNLLGGSQHGFRSGRSTVTNLLEFYHHMFVTLDRSRAVDILYLDFRKAFDKVPHRRLLSKVRALGIVDEVATWVENWLVDRRQRVVVNGVPSGWTAVTSGVPQGSVLGPLLFLIYINDLDEGIISRVSKFADDTKLGIDAADPALVECLRLDLVRIGEWSEKWQMPFNTDKCHIMHVGSRNFNEGYSLLGRPVKVVPQEVDLGVIVTEEFRFSAQCIRAERKAQKILGYVKRVFHYRNKTTVLTLYNSMVRPLLEYAAQFWSPNMQADIKRLERVQERATKLVPSIRFKGYQRRLRDLKLFTLEQRRLRGQLIETFKYLRGFNSADAGELFTLSNNPTRNHGYKVVPPRFNTVRLRDFPTVRICNVWNALPERVVTANSVETFKRRIDRLLPNLNY